MLIFGKSGVTKPCCLRHSMLDEMFRKHDFVLVINLITDDATTQVLETIQLGPVLKLENYVGSESVGVYMVRTDEFRGVDIHVRRLT